MLIISRGIEHKVTLHLLVMFVLVVQEVVGEEL